LYSFNTKGNLEYRADNLTNQKEVFGYDGLNRLTSWNVYQNSALEKQNSLVYDANGNIETRSDIDNLTMNYGENGKPHALTSISGKPDAFPSDSLTVTYTDFKKIATLSESNKFYALSYGVDDERRKSIYTVGGTTKLTRYYLGDYEEEVDAAGNVRQIHYLSGGAVFIRNNSKDSLLYGYSDNQGSLIALTDENGTVLERYAYDPWGQRRNPDDWTAADFRTGWRLNRGYTMHEHLDAFAIINMNGRVYDPLTGMFFSPDPQLQDPGNWLNYNRYGYCINNPLKYTDPTGEIFGSIFTFLWEGTKAVVKSTRDFVKTAFFEGGLDPTSSNARQNAWDNYGDDFRGYWTDFDPTKSGNKTNNAIKIDAGLFLHIPGWETPQTILGNLVSHTRNLSGNVDNVEIRNGVVLVNDNDPSSRRRWGMTLGPYINSENIEVGDDMYWHELGHSIQSRILGPLYITKVGIPSLMSATFGSDEYHSNSWYEVWANRLGGVPESNEYPRDYRRNNFWYWWWITTLPIYPN